MSETEKPQQPGWVDLSDLRMMPDWVASFGKSSPAAHEPAREYEEGERGGQRREGRGGFRDRGREGGGRFGGGAGGGRPPMRGERREGGGPGERRGGGGFGGGQRERGEGGRRDFRDRGDRRGGSGGGGRMRRDDREPLVIPTDITVSVEVDDKAVDALAAHVRQTGHAFSMFDASRLVLAGPERYKLRFVCAEQRTPGLFRVTADGGLYLSREEAVRHILRGDVLSEYYRAEEFEREEPKGEFQSIAVCGFSGELLGPPSHHSYQAALIRLHREKFANMPLDEYRLRVRVESSPELVAKWKEQQKTGMRWIYLKGEVAEGAEPQSFQSRADVEAHFRRYHSEGAIEEVREGTVSGGANKFLLSHALSIMGRSAVENARKHLFEMSQKLGHALEKRGMKLFKRRSGKLFVSRIRPRAIEPGVVFSERVTRMVDLIRQEPGLSVAKLVESMAAPVAAAPLAPAAEASVEEVPAVAEPTPAAAPQLSADQIALIKDLRWLCDEGFIIEYSDGVLFLGVQGEGAPAAPKAATANAAEAKPEVPGPAAEAAETPVEPAGEEGVVADDKTAVAEAEIESVAPEPAPAEPETPAASEVQEEAAAESSESAVASVTTPEAETTPGAADPAAEA